MKLTVLERLLLLGILPVEGNHATLRIVRQLRERLSFSEEELKEYSIQWKGEQVTWNPAAEPPEGSEIPIGERANDIIVEAFKKLDREAKLTEQLLPLYEKFVKD